MTIFKKRIFQRDKRQEKGELKEAAIGFWIQELDKWEVLWINEKLVIGLERKVKGLERENL